MAFGSIIFGQTNPSRFRVIIIYVLFALNDLCVIAMALTHSFGLACLFVGLRGLCIECGIGVWNALTAVVAGLFSPATILIVGFGLSAILWTAPLASRRVREAA